MNATTPTDRKGFTLIELMLAAILGAVVLTAFSLLISRAWQSSATFVSQEITMDEIRVLEAAFQKEAREKGNGIITNTVCNEVTFYDESGTASFVYDGARKSIIYTMADGQEMELLEASTVSGFRVKPVTNTNTNTTTTALRMVVTIRENELNGKENEYAIAAKTR
jgi:prepilin-type N-terminal cleavage/methylation domain-containing protein